jgi:hypothetical protein
VTHSRSLHLSRLDHPGTYLGRVLEPYGACSLASPYHACTSGLFSPCSTRNLVAVLLKICPPIPLRTPQQPLPPRYSSNLLASNCAVTKLGEIDPLFMLIRFHGLIFLTISCNGWHQGSKVATGRPREQIFLFLLLFSTELSQTWIETCLD